MSQSRDGGGGTLPGHRVRARNLARYSANKIHDDTVARTYGFAGGLVAGTTVYAYMTAPLVRAWGLDWLGRGTGRLALHHPVYDGEEVTVEARVVGRSGAEAAGEVVAEVTALGPRGAVASLVAGLGWGGPPVMPDPVGYPAAALPGTRRPASAEALAVQDALGSPTLRLDEAETAGYAADVDDPLPIYRGPEAVAHPGQLLQQANRALSENVALGPWVHVESQVAHCGLARVGDRLTTRGRVARVFEKKGHEFVELDLLVVADEGRPILQVRHLAIYRLASRPGREPSAAPSRSATG
jgi:acyl dehydratase